MSASLATRSLRLVRLRSAPLLAPLAAPLRAAAGSASAALPAPPQLRARPRASSSAATAASDANGDSSSSNVAAACPLQARQLFEDVWAEIAGAVPIEQLVFPREIVWLTGAPGAGKGTLSGVIKRERDILSQFEVSSLLSTPEFKRRKEAGLLIGDRDVIKAVISALLRKEFRGGVIVDGYPRTEVQAHVIRLLRDRLEELWSEHRSHPELRRVLQRPVFQIVCFYCSEEESVRRQLHRGEELAKTNRIVAETGIGAAQATRATDVSPEAARLRYKVFREEVYGSLQAVKSHLAFHFINADGDPDSVKKQLVREFAYQSSFDLGDEVHTIVRAVPSASAIIRQARSSLVQRLAGYAMDNAELFAQVVGLLESAFVPLLRRQSLAGEAVIRSESTLFNSPAAINMALDVLAERGYTCILDVVRESVPTRVNLATGALESRVSKVFVFRVSFPRPEIRRNEG
jgi:adenylate kinase